MPDTSLIDRIPRCCSSACTTPVDRRWPRVGSATSPATGSSSAPAGTEPADAINPAVVEAMAEVGIDIADGVPSRWTDEVVRGVRRRRHDGLRRRVPVFPGKRYEDWELDDPAGQDVAAVRPIRDEIRRRVKH